MTGSVRELRQWLRRETGLAREQLYKSRSATGNPPFETMMAVLKAMEFRITGKLSAA